jgi:L-Ala-D/L-Glu epimerase
VIRAALPADIAAMAEVFVAAWRAGYRGVVPDEIIDGLDPADVAGWFDPAWLGPDLRSVVAQSPSGAVSGFARFGADPDRPGPSFGYLAALYVDPAASGQGTGRALLDHVVDALSREGRSDISLWVFAGNVRARSLYERAGFRPEGHVLVDPRWQTPQTRYRRRPTNRGRTLPDLAEVSWAPIASLDVTPVIQPLRQPFRTALREVRELRGWQVRVTTADGLAGIGTTVATPLITGDTDESILEACSGPLRRAVLGATRLVDVLPALARAVAGVPSARAAVDLALHDLAVRQTSSSLAGLLDAAATPGPVRSDITVSLDAPAVMAEQASLRLAEGFDTLKLKLGDAATDASRVAGVARVIADHQARTGASVALRLDANQAWTAEESLEVLGQIADAGIAIELVEQPVRAADLAGLARVTRLGPFPVLADESAFTGDDVRRLAGAGAAHMVNLKLLKCGGLWPARDVVAACQETGMGLLIGCMLEPAAGVDAARALASLASIGPLAHDLDAAWWAAPEQPAAATARPPEQ